MATWVAGLGDQSDADYFRGLRQLLSYDPDQVQLLYATPHRWTPFYATVKDHRVVQPDAQVREAQALRRPCREVGVGP